MHPSSPSAPAPAQSAGVRSMFADPEPRFSVCVYCASQPGENEAFRTTAREVGSWIARNGGQLVYGGSHTGLMGIVADAALQAGGRVVGVIPKALVEREWAHEGCTELHIVETMHQRKHMMAERERAVHLVIDGLPAHKKACVKEYVASTGGKLTLHLLPGYAPDLNPDELVWSHAKRTGVARSPLRKGEKLKERVGAQLQAVADDPALVRSFFRHPSVAYISDL